MGIAHRAGIVGVNGLRGPPPQMAQQLRAREAITLASRGSSLEYGP